MRVMLFASAMLLLAAACSGPTTTSGGSGTASTPVPGGSTAAATSAASNTTGGSTAGGTTDACTLITVDEAARVMSASGVKAEPSSGDPAYCTYRDGTGNPVVATAYMKSGAAAVFAALAGSSQSVPGLGERALWEPNSAALMILKGGTVLSITAGSGTVPLAQRLELAKQLGALGVARQ